MHQHQLKVKMMRLCMKRNMKFKISNYYYEYLSIVGTYKIIDDLTDYKIIKHVLFFKIIIVNLNI